MSAFRGIWLASILALTGMCLAPLSAEAYLGPGGVVSGIGAFIALVAAVVASVFGFLWFPLKRLLRRFRGGNEESRAKVPTPAPTATQE